MIDGPVKLLIYSCEILHEQYETELGEKFLFHHVVLTKQLIAQEIRLDIRTALDRQALTYYNRIEVKWLEIYSCFRIFFVHPKQQYSLS